MLAWRGQLRHTPWPGRATDTSFELELWGSTQRSAFLTTEWLEFETYADVSAVPLPALHGPAMTVYSRDEETVEYFGELAGNGVGLVARLVSQNRRDGQERDRKHSFEQLIFYCLRDTDSDSGAWSVYARPFVPHSGLRPSETPQLETNALQVASIEHDLPAAAAAPAIPGEPAITGIHGPAKALQQVILAALRLRGVKRDHPDFKQLYHLTYRAAEFALRKAASPIRVELMREKVEMLLAILDA